MTALAHAVQASVPVTRPGLAFLRPSPERPGWWRIESPLAPDDPLRTLPGVAERLGRTAAWLEVHHSLVCARTDLFTWLPADETPPAQGDLLEHEPALNDYQRAAVEFAGLGAVLAWDMGTGKTRTATAIVRRHVGTGPVVVCGPLIARAAWCGKRSDPWKLWGIDVQPLEGRKSARQGDLRDGAGWWFLNYDIVEAWLGRLLVELKPAAVIFDETHLLRTPKADRSRACHALSRLRTVDLRVALSGTPIEAALIDLHASLDLAFPDAFGKRHDFGTRYCEGFRDGYSWKYEGRSNLDELETRLSATLLRRTRRESLAQLPPITRQVVEVELGAVARQHYDDLFRDVRKVIVAEGGSLAHGLAGEALTRYGRLCAELSRLKATHVGPLIGQALQTHKKVVVFAWYKESVRTLAAAARSTGAVEVWRATGAETIENRLKAAEDFADFDGPGVFVGTIAACAHALNALSRASCVIFADLYWLASLLLQAEARVWRPEEGGETRDGIQAIYVVAPNTVDEPMIDALFKRAEDAAVVGAGEEGALTAMLAKADERTAAEAEALSRLLDGIAALKLEDEG